MQDTINVNKWIIEFSTKSGEKDSIEFLPYISKPYYSKSIFGKKFEHTGPRVCEKIPKLDSYADLDILICVSGKTIFWRDVDMDSISVRRINYNAPLNWEYTNGDF